MSLTSKKAVGVLSRGLARIAHLSSFVEAEVTRVRGFGMRVARLDAVAGWGRRAPAESARAYARKNGIDRYLCLEDGFLRSTGLGVAGAPPLSIVVDELGIYYDASTISQLEEIIQRAGQSEVLLANARKAIDLIRRNKLSKYNSAPPHILPPSLSGKRVLLIDQTAGDMSVKCGGADADTFAAMLSAAIQEHPDTEIWVKTHPDVIAGKKRGYLASIACTARVRLLAIDCCPMTLIEQFDHVYVVTSQMGFEALMLGKTVTVFGQPWYAGWGLTDDRHPGMAKLRRRRSVPRTLEQLFAAAYLQYARYIEPATGRPGTIFDVIDWLARNKTIDNESRGTNVCVGMSLWKRTIVRPFLTTPSSRVQFVRSLDVEDLEALPDGSRIVLWGSHHSDLARQATSLGIPVMRIEDGFVRSNGLGSDLYGPLSLAIDGPGIYYDPFSRSKLESLLASAVLDDEQRERAAALRKMLVQQKISKYNVGRPFQLNPESRGRRVLLVPGQVEDDASIAAGSPIVKSNRDLLLMVRKANPNAWIIYKPHPDVVAGNRRGQMPLDQLQGIADEVAANASIADCIVAADEVHTMTSLAGFEALLFGKQVHCYGGPFYAGWGLTIDHLALPHRQRQLTLDELIYVTLCQYPRYRLPGVDGFCSAEDVVLHIAQRRKSSPANMGSNWIIRQWRKACQLVRVVNQS
ncbi:capsular polysaccharide biosynthesis protein [Cupriavidus gilardii]|uniref:capsular polysaccharide biosynthesis protein n=1 Tax=Cupriavidus gilardii TaxID=82541 RepID=UPI0021C0F7A1|nr:capsular polysaccharide biosynthesis protein [Cupriavidus gilardii]MCT9114960.1 capsular polysaccharide biosynthesis protein [Cupriavidus gilardii]